MPVVFGRTFGRDEGEDRSDPTDLTDPADLSDPTDFDDEEEGEADELSDFDDDARAQVEAIVARHEQVAREQMSTALRTQAQARGFDLAADGSLLISDPGKAQSWLGIGAHTPPLAAAPPAPAAPSITLDQIPDPTIYPEEHKRWLDAYVQQQVDQRSQAMLPAVQQTQQMVAQMAAANATQRVVARLNEMGYGQLAAHPQFIAKFGEALSHVDMGYWSDDPSLARVAFALIPDLALSAPAQPARRRTQGVDPAAVASNLASRAGVDGFAASKSGGAAPRPDTGSDTDRLYAKALNMSVEEVRALKNTTSDAYDALKAKQRQKARR